MEITSSIYNTMETSGKYNTMEIESCKYNTMEKTYYTMNNKKTQLKKPINFFLFLYNNMILILKIKNAYYYGEFFFKK